MNFLQNKIELKQQGFSITPKIYEDNEIINIIALLNNIKSNSQLIIKTKELFAIRQLINVNEKRDLKEYNNWTKKRGQIGVQPPIEILENIVTIRIHLDDTTRNNGALRIIPKSHLNGIIRADKANIKVEDEIICEIKKGACMLMKPLIMHASNRTKNEKQRRVIHLEFSNKQLKEPLKWKEMQIL